MASGGKASALPVIIVGLVVCGLPAYVLATLFGAGSVAMIAMMVSLFTFISIIGGSLLADMKTASVVAPLIFVAATVPRLASEWSAAAGAVAACACMLAVVLLPLHDNAERPIVLTEAFTEYSAASDELRREHAGDAADSDRREQVERFALACFDLVLCGIDDVLAGRGAIGDIVEQAGRVSFGAPPGRAEPDGQPGVAGLIAHAQRLGASLCASPELEMNGLQTTEGAKA